MNFKQIKAPFYTEPLDLKNIEKTCGESIYAILNILGIRSNQIKKLIKIELNKKLENINLIHSSKEKVREKKIKLYKDYENLPPYNSIAIKELLTGTLLFSKLNHRA